MEFKLEELEGTARRAIAAWCGPTVCTCCGGVRLAKLGETIKR